MNAAKSRIRSIASGAIRAVVLTQSSDSGVLPLCADLSAPRACAISVTVIQDSARPCGLPDRVRPWRDLSEASDPNRDAVWKSGGQFKRTAHFMNKLA